MTNTTTTTTTTYAYPRADFSIVGAYYVAYENSDRSGASGVAFFSPIAIAHEHAENDEYRSEARAHALRRAIAKHAKMAGRVERCCVFVASGDDDRQRFTTADAGALARFLAKNDLRVVEGTAPRWFLLAQAGATAAPAAPATVATAIATTVDADDFYADDADDFDAWATSEESAIMAEIDAEMSAAGIAY